MLQSATRWCQRRLSRSWLEWGIFSRSRIM